MPIKKLLTGLLITTGVVPFLALAADSEKQPPVEEVIYQPSPAELAEQLGWVPSDDNNCGGYYLDEPFVYPVSVDEKKTVEVTSNHALVSQLTTSILEGEVTVNRAGQQMTANRAYVYRDDKGKLSTLDMIGNVHLREPNTLILGKRGHYNFSTQTKSILDIMYRTSFVNRQIVRPQVSDEEMHTARRIKDLTAWGSASEVSQLEPRVYELNQATFSTCPPINPTWKVKASHIVLNKNTGRGYATNARLMVKGLPVLYLPYLNFSIDRQRKSGFLTPTPGVSNQWGPYLLTPFYWNMAPNYDMTITPGYLSKRGVQISDRFRYLSELGSGMMNFSILPNDRDFAAFQAASLNDPTYTKSPDLQIQAELPRLESASTTRKGFFWRDNSIYSEHWSSQIDFNYASDDYYMQNFGSNLNEITKNQLPQEANLYYKGQNWNFTGRVQAYQTLHPINESDVLNQYRRLPQLILTADYPDQPFGLEYFITNEFTHFDILNTPGTLANLPVGNRMHMQPGVSLPISTPYFFINPRAQIALTQYQMYENSFTDTPGVKKRSIPIFDIASGLFFDRNASWFGHPFQQTLEPQVYYTYIPYHDQSDIPEFDTTVNTLTYSQIFNYNRFTGIDRIGDANQIGMGVTSRLIDQETGAEKVRMGLGGIVYFANRRVTFCNSNLQCQDYPGNPSNQQKISPLSGILDYHVNDRWQFSVTPIWNVLTKQLDNTLLSLHYQTDNDHILHFGYSYARGGDILSGVQTTDPSNNLKVTELAVVWPLFRDISAMGRWSQNWNHEHLQNLLYGLQYDTCCWAVRLVGGRAFMGLNPTFNNKPIYNNQFYLQVSLKGLGDVQSGNPGGLLNSINGYRSQFGQEF